MGFWIREYIQEVGHMNWTKFIKYLNSILNRLKIVWKFKRTIISSIYVNRLELKTIKSLTVLVLCLKNWYDPLAQTHKNMFVLHLNFCFCIYVSFFENPKRFSTTDGEELIFKISKAKLDEQTGWLSHLKCLKWFIRLNQKLRCFKFVNQCLIWKSYQIISWFIKLNHNYFGLW